MNAATVLILLVGSGFWGAATGARRASRPRPRPEAPRLGPSWQSRGSRIEARTAPTSSGTRRRRCWRRN